MDESVPQTLTVLSPRHSGTDNRPTNQLPEEDTSTKINGQSGQELTIEAANNSHILQQGTSYKVIEPQKAAENHLESEEPKTQLTSQFLATADQEGDSKKRSCNKGKYRMSEESKTTKTNNQIRVSYHKEETVEQKNGEKHFTSESYVKYYTETGYARKKENKKFWKKFWNLLRWMLATLALVGILYIPIFGYQQAGDPLYTDCNQSIGSQQFHKSPGSDTKLKINWDSPTGSSKRQTQTGSDTCSELGSNKVTNRSTSQQPMTLATTMSRPTSRQPMNPNNHSKILI